MGKDTTYSSLLRMRERGLGVNGYTILENRIYIPTLPKLPINTAWKKIRFKRRIFFRLTLKLHSKIRVQNEIRYSFKKINIIGKYSFCLAF